MPSVLLLDAVGQLLMIALVKLSAMAGSAAFGLAWLVTGTMGFLFASIFARGFVILALAHAIWLAAGVVRDELGRRRETLRHWLAETCYDLLMRLPRLSSAR